MRIIPEFEFNKVEIGGTLGWKVVSGVSELLEISEL